VPSSKTQRYLGYIGAMGVLTACFGCGLVANNQITAGNVFLIAAWFILVPLFGYLISARRQAKRVVQARAVRKQEELDALAAVAREGSGIRDQGSGVGGSISDDAADAARNDTDGV